MSTIYENKLILSIVVPVYNVEQFLCRCLDSILAQLKSDMEVIIVDDGSKDNSSQICDQYKSKYGSVLTVIHQMNSGLSAARNTGIENAHGEYIYFLDSDDYISDNFIDSVYTYLITHKYDILEFKTYWQTKDNIVSLKTSNDVYEFSRLEMIDRLIKNEVGCQIWLRIYRTELFKDIRFPEGRNYEDIATYYKLLMISNFNLFIDSQIHIYNLLNYNSITQKASFKNLNDMYCSLNEMHDALKLFVLDNSLDSIYLEYYKRCIYIYILLKLRKAKFVDNDTYKNIRKYLQKNSNYCCLKYKNYNLKRLFVYKLLNLFHYF